MLEVRGVSKHYGSIRALDLVSLHVEPGEVVALVGENGAGKSTLVRSVARAVLPDSGEIIVGGSPLGRTPRSAIDAGISVVWQDLALCENLDVTSNLFLGRELDRAGTLRGAAMLARAQAVFRRLAVPIPELDRPVERLSGGQRQLVAIGRATLDEPKVLVLDEPTAALGVTESETVLGVVKTLQSRGVAILLVSHQLDEVFSVADRIVVLRHGRVVADLHRAETHRDDVVGLMTGADVDSTAGQQLRRLHSLAEQLADADQSAVLPLTVSSLSAALSVDRLAIFMVDDTSTATAFSRSASLHLADELTERLDEIAGGADRGFLATAASERALVVVPEVRHRRADPVAAAAHASGLVGAWAAPVVGQRGTLALIVGFTETIAQLQPDQIQLLDLFSTMAGAAIDRGRLVETLRTQNQSLEGLHGVLETLAGPSLLGAGMPMALDALCRGLSCDGAFLLVDEADGWRERAASSAVRAAGHPARAQVVAALDGAADAHGVLADRFEWSRGRAALAGWWSDGPIPPEASQLLGGAANSFRLAMERELTAEAEREAQALQRSRELERELARRLGHELRTPLTAIRGFASTMLQPDVEWADHDKERFLAIIEDEAGRMGRLVAQLFDDTAIDSGSLRLDFNYCDLVAVIESAASIAGPTGAIAIDLPHHFTVWADRDRLEQVFVNLIGNAIGHNDEDTKVRVVLTEPPSGGSEVTVVVADDGTGMAEDELAFVNGEIDDRAKDRGLGLRLVRGFVRAHGGRIDARVDGGTVVEVTLPIEGSVP